MKSPQKVSASGATGPSPWLVLDYLQRPFDVGLFASLSSDGNLTYKVQHTPDNPFLLVDVLSITRAGTTATATFANPHGLSAGDSIVITRSGDPNLDGTYTVATTPTTTTLTYTVANTGAAADQGKSSAVLMRVFDHAYMTGLTARQDGNYGFPCLATRVNITAWTAGGVTLEVVQGNARG